MGGTVGFNAWARAVHHRNCSLIWGLVPVILQSFIQPADQQTLSLVGFGPNTARRPVHNFTPPSCPWIQIISPNCPLDIPSQNILPNSPPTPLKHGMLQRTWRWGWWPYARAGCIWCIGIAFMLAILCSFFHFIRRFWNQILICRSVKQSACAISILDLFNLDFSPTFSTFKISVMLSGSVTCACA